MPLSTDAQIAQDAGGREADLLRAGDAESVRLVGTPVVNDRGVRQSRVGNGVGGVDCEECTYELVHDLSFPAG